MSRSRLNPPLTLASSLLDDELAGIECEPRPYVAPDYDVVATEPAPRREAPVSVEVRFRHPGDHETVTSELFVPEIGAAVVVESERGPDFATVVAVGAPAEESGGRKLLRRANDADFKTREHMKNREVEAFSYCRDQISSHGLPMHLVGVEFPLSGTRATFYFTSADRVDFRALVKDLARRFHTRIELRQQGVRDAARHTGGNGSCGRKLCCSGWLPAFESVTLRMAKDQNLSLNHQNLAGVCGRLRCCLQYEDDHYRAQRKTLPKLGKRVLSPQGEGRVKDINVLAGTVRVQLDEGEYLEFAGSELQTPPTIVAQQKRQAEAEQREGKDSPSAKRRKRRKRQKKPAE